MTSLHATFQGCRRAGRAAFIPYVVAGHPSLEESAEVIATLAANGADIIEVGVPFSDPIADGPVIRQAAHRALQNGASLRRTLEMIAGLRRSGINVPIVLMGYANPFLAYGLPALARDAGDLIQGLVVPDLPADEAMAWRARIDDSAFHLIGFVAPTTTTDRLRTIGREASGFLYCISVKGITGRRDSVPQGLEADLARYREMTALPLAVGFGLSTPDQVRSVSRMADGVIVGSALVERIDAASPGRAAQAARDYVATLLPATRFTASRNVEDSCSSH